jgi:tetratricopeptide (TPR) repeat protein
VRRDGGEEAVALEREPFAFGYAVAALAYAEKGEFGRAVEAMEKATKLESNTTLTALTAHVQAAKGNRREAEKLLADLKAVSRRSYVCAYEMAHAYAKLGDKKQAFEWLEKGKQERADCMVWLLSEPWMDPLRGGAAVPGAAGRHWAGHRKGRAEAVVLRDPAGCRSPKSHRLESHLLLGLEDPLPLCG